MSDWASSPGVGGNLDPEQVSDADASVVADDAAWEPLNLPADWDPTEAVMRNLVAQHKGDPWNEEETAYASMALACSALMSRGIDYDTAADMVEQAMDKGDIRISYSKDEGLRVTIGDDDDA